MTPDQVLQRLKDGNARFTSGKRAKRNLLKQLHETAGGQYPYAVILSCIDSRTAATLVFDQGIGDVFNARVAGNIENEDILGSMEFACALAGAKLIVVEGHSSCGAVRGACDHAQLGNLTHLLKNIEPAVTTCNSVAGDHSSKNEDYVAAVAKANVLQTVADIRSRSGVLAVLEKEGKIKIVGALYHLDTGIVEWY
jgi:carbonic anhydrase